MDQHMKSAFLLAFLFFSLAAKAQVLLPGIGLDQLPSDADSICDIQVYIDPDGTYMSPAHQQGDTIPEFKLYDLSGDSLVLSEALSARPVLLVGGSYTCPVFRNKVQQINAVHNFYQGDVDVFVIYSVEAHPIVDISPYFGFVNPGTANQDQGILYEQPKTYGERRQIVADMQNNMNILPPVYIDGPCNEYWLNYGLAPNNAYLIDTNGVVFSKHGWFNKPPHNIQNDIDSLLGNIILPPDTNSGAFDFQFVGDTISHGASGETLYVYGQLWNSTAYNVTVQIVREEEAVPADWSTSICTEQFCLPPNVSSTQIIIAPDDTSSYTMYFYTAGPDDSGHTRMRFVNTDDPQNEEVHYFYASTAATTVQEVAEHALVLNPNPAQDKVWIYGASGTLKYTCFNMLGLPCIRGTVHAGESIDLGGLANGHYILLVEDRSGQLMRSAFVKE